MKKLSVIICTRNRSFILPQCLESLLHQNGKAEQYDIIVVDNGSTDETQKIVNRHPNATYIFEPKIGLSIARNSGYAATTTEWVGYIDDDAKARPNLVERALWVIDQYDFDAFGGMYYPWFKYGRPKWLPDNYGTKEKLLDAIGSIHTPQLSGGIFFIKRTVIESVGGFSEDFGMGKKIGYSEENELQAKLLAQGMRLGFDPELIIDHCVLPHKLSVWWHLKSEHAKVRDSEKLALQQHLARHLFGLLRSVLALGYKLPIGTYHLLTQRQYFWQNLILDSFIPIVRMTGRISSILSSKKDR